jgi:hypothetical protein
MDETRRIYTGTDRRAGVHGRRLSGRERSGSYILSISAATRHRPPVCRRLPDFKGAIVMNNGLESAAAGY